MDELLVPEDQMIWITWDFHKSCWQGRGDLLIKNRQPQIHRKSRSAVKPTVWNQLEAATPERTGQTKSRTVTFKIFSILKTNGIWGEDLYIGTFQTQANVYSLPWFGFGVGPLRYPPIRTHCQSLNGKRNQLPILWGGLSSAETYTTIN